MNTSTNPERNTQGFTMVEIMVATMVFAFAIFPMIGMLALSIDSHADTSDQRAINNSMEALGVYLNEEIGFDEVFRWSEADNSELVYLAFQSTSEGNPDESGTIVKSQWMDFGKQEQWEFPYEIYESARVGPWIKCSITLNKDLTPDAKDLIPEQNACGYLVFNAKFYSVQSPTQPNADLRPLATIHPVVRR